MEYKFMRIRKNTYDAIKEAAYNGNTSMISLLEEIIRKICTEKEI